MHVCSLFSVKTRFSCWFSIGWWYSHAGSLCFGCVISIVVSLHLLILNFQADINDAWRSKKVCQNQIWKDVAYLWIKHPEKWESFKIFTCLGTSCKPHEMSYELSSISIYHVFINDSCSLWKHLFTMQYLQNGNSFFLFILVVKLQGWRCCHSLPEPQICCQWRSLRKLNRFWRHVWELVLLAPCICSYLTLVLGRPGHWIGSVFGEGFSFMLFGRVTYLVSWSIGFS